MNYLNKEELVDEMKVVNLFYKIKTLKKTDRLEIPELGIKSVKKIDESKYYILNILTDFYNDKHKLDVQKELPSRIDINEEYRYYRNYISSYSRESILYTPYVTTDKIGINKQSLKMGGTNIILASPDISLKISRGICIKGHSALTYFDKVIREQIKIEGNSKLYKSILNYIIDSDYSIDVICHIIDAIKPIENIRSSGKKYKQIMNMDIKTLLNLMKMEVINIHK